MYTKHAKLLAYFTIQSILMETIVKIHSLKIKTLLRVRNLKKNVLKLGLFIMKILQLNNVNMGLSFWDNIRTPDKHA